MRVVMICVCVAVLLLSAVPSAFAQTLVIGAVPYRWWNMTTAMAATNQTVAWALNDGNLTADGPNLGDSMSVQNYEAAGLVWATNQNVTSFDFVQGGTTGDGWWTNAVPLQVQSFNGTAWASLTGWSLSPSYPYSVSGIGATYTFSGPSVSVRGIRVVGVVWSSSADSYYAVLREIRAYYTATPTATSLPTATATAIVMATAMATSLPTATATAFVLVTATVAVILSPTADTLSVLQAISARDSQVASFQLFGTVSTLAVGIFLLAFLIVGGRR